VLLLLAQTMLLYQVSVLQITTMYHYIFALACQISIHLFFYKLVVSIWQLRMRVAVRKQFTTALYIAYAHLMSRLLLTATL
jgi:hypothetical protein